MPASRHNDWPDACDIHPLTLSDNQCIVFDMSILSRLSFWLAYLRGLTPWDTNITPPELVDIIEGPSGLAAGRALDLGCGTGTNVIYLAQHGWDATGVDFVNKAIKRARLKARQAGVATRFFTGDIRRLNQIKGLTGTFDLVLDIGCFHSLSAEGRTHYAADLVTRLRPGATFLLYAWGPSTGRDPSRGVTPAQVEATFAPRLRVVRIQHGEDRGRPSGWYWLAPSPEG